MPFPIELAAPVYPKGATPVGTPVKVFEPYKAPAFTSPAVPVGGIVTAVTMQSTTAMDQVNVPFTFGHAFKKGDLSPDCALVGAIQGQPDLPLQVDVKATHDDGSVRHAIVSGVLPRLSAVASVAMGLRRAAVPSITASGTPLPKALPSALLVIGGAAYTAMPMSTGSAAIWLSGPMVSDYVLNVPLMDASGNQHPTLTVQFSVRAYSSGAVRVDAVIEHCKAYASNADITYDVTLSANGAIMYSQTGLVHTPCARWKKTFWYGTAPSLHIKHDTAYLIASRQVSNYDQSVKPDETELQGYAKSLAADNFGPMGFGRWQPAMGTTGGRPDIGIMPDSYVMTLLSMDKRAKDMMLASADCAGSWPTHRRDDSNGPAKGAPIDILHFPCSTILGTASDAQNYATGKSEKFPVLSTATVGDPDGSHQPAVAYLPYLLTGDYYYLEELHFWCNFVLYMMNPAYRGCEKGMLYPDQVRGQGWDIRTLGQCTAITPDNHPSKQSFLYWLETNLAWYNSYYTDGANNKLGVLTRGYMLVYNGNRGLAPWQDDHFTSSLGHVIELTDLESAKRLMRWKTKFQFGRLLDPDACPAYAANYTLNVRPTDTAPFYETLGECFRDSLSSVAGAYDAARNTPERLNADPVAPFVVPDGYPEETAGFMANYQPALAAAVDSGMEDGVKAWKVFMARTPKPNYGTSPQFAIVPRLLTEAAAKPAPTPVTGVIKAPTSTKLAKLTGLSMTVFNPSTLASAKRFTNLTASSKGALTVKDAALVPGTVYAAAVADSAGNVLVVMHPLKAV